MKSFEQRKAERGLWIDDWADPIMGINYVSIRVKIFFKAEDGIRDLIVTGVQTCALPIYTFDFFFQAEDGIRDLIVTGVQTCALPIWQHQADRRKRDQHREQQDLGD